MPLGDALAVRGCSRASIGRVDVGGQRQYWAARRPVGESLLVPDIRREQRLMALREHRLGVPAVHVGWRQERDAAMVMLVVVDHGVRLDLKA